MFFKCVNFKSFSNIFKNQVPWLKWVIQSCQMSNVTCQMTNFTCQMSSDKWQISNVKLKMTTVKCQILNVKWQLSNVKYQMSNAKCQIANIKIKCQMSNANVRSNQYILWDLSRSYEISDILWDLNYVVLQSECVDLASASIVYWCSVFFVWPPPYSRRPFWFETGVEWGRDDGRLLLHVHLLACPQPASNQRESRFSRILEIFFEISPLDLGLEVFKFHFHFSKRVKQKIISLFISRKGWKEYLFHFSFLEKSESISDFTLFLEKKEWNCACNSVFYFVLFMKNAKKLVT